jgi:hypothetical protein
MWCPPPEGGGTTQSAQSAQSAPRLSGAERGQLPHGGLGLACASRTLANLGPGWDTKVALSVPELGVVGTLRLDLPQVLKLGQIPPSNPSAPYSYTGPSRTVPGPDSLVSLVEVDWIGLSIIRLVNHGSKADNISLVRLVIGLACKPIGAISHNIG